jgi:hypothetical protein
MLHMLSKVRVMIENADALRECVAQVKAMENWAVSDAEARRLFQRAMRENEKRKPSLKWLPRLVCTCCELAGPDVADPVLRELIDARNEGARLYEMRQALKREGRKPALRAGSRVVAPEAKTA